MTFEPRAVGSKVITRNNCTHAEGSLRTRQVLYDECSKGGAVNTPTQITTRICNIWHLFFSFQDDLSNYVHKQGFLVKQGRRVKNWKRRLFVLDSNGLSYYRTEQPIHKISLSDMKKIQVAHNQ